MEGAGEREAGLSLIQVLVALAVVAILAAVAYPTYQDALRRARRAEGRAALFQALEQQERYYTQRNTYIAFSSDSGGADERQFRWFSGNMAAASAYELKAEACPDETIRDCVQLTAMPGTGKVDENFRDPHCGELKLSSTGDRSAGAPDCWR